MRNLAGRTAVLTGASEGIGLYISREFAKEQMNLVLAALPTSNLEGIVAEVRGNGVSAIAVPTDVSNQSSLKALISRTNHEYGAIDVLVNNASVHMAFPYHKVPAEKIEHLIRTNLTGSMLLTQMALPGMLERHQGHIVNVSSLAGKTAPPFCEAYAASKAGLIAFTKSLRITYHGSGVSASVICPGFVEAGMYQRMREETGLDPPWFLGTSCAETVSRAIVHAIKKDIPEVIVNPRPARLLTALAELFPSLSERVIQFSGIADWYERYAEARERRAKANQDKIYT